MGSKRFFSLLKRGSKSPRLILMYKWTKNKLTGTDISLSISVRPHFWYSQRWHENSIYTEAVLITFFISCRSFFISSRIHRYWMPLTHWKFNEKPFWLVRIKICVDYFSDHPVFSVLMFWNFNAGTKINRDHFDLCGNIPLQKVGELAAPYLHAHQCLLFATDEYHV